MYYKSLPEENNEEIIKKGSERFEEIRKKVRLEPRFNGYFIVIDVDSGEYFLGEKEIEALEKAEAKLGKKNFFIHRCQFF